MARTIAVSDEVYELLEKLKLPQESFSDVIKRIIKRGGRLMDIAGRKTITKEEWDLVMKKVNVIKEAEIKKKLNIISKIYD